MKFGVGFFHFSVLWSGIHAHGRRTNAKGWKKKSSKSSSTTNNELFSCDDTGLVAQYCPRATNVAVISHADNSNQKFWDVWKEGAEGALGGSINLTFMDVGYDAKKGAEAIEDVCNSRDYDALVVTVPYEKDTYEYVLLDEVIGACAVKGKPIFTTNTDTYHNEHVYAFVGSGNYDMGRSCAQAVLHPDDMDVALGRKEAPLTSFIDRNVTYSFYREDEEQNGSLNRRVQGLVDEFKKKEIDVKEFTGFDSNLDRDEVVFVMSMNHISKFDWPNAFLCGDEDVSRPDIRQYGQSPFMQGLTAVLTAAAAADIKYKGREWNTAKGNPSDGGTIVSTQSVRSTSVANVCPESPNNPCVPVEMLPFGSTLGISVDLSTRRSTSTKPNVLQKVSKIKRVSQIIGNDQVQYMKHKSIKDFSRFISSEADVKINYFLASASASVKFTTLNSGSNTRETLMARGYKWDNATFFDRSELQEAMVNPDFLNDLRNACNMYKVKKDRKHFDTLLKVWGTHFISSQYYGGYAVAKMSLDYVTSTLKESFAVEAEVTIPTVFTSVKVSAKFKREAEKNESEITIRQEYKSRFNGQSLDPDSTETRNDPYKMKKWIDNLIGTENNGVVLVSQLSPWTVLPQVKKVLNDELGFLFDPNKIYPKHVYDGTSRLRDAGIVSAYIDYALTFVDSKLAIISADHSKTQELEKIKKNILEKKEVIDQVYYWGGYFKPFVTTKNEIDALLINVTESVIIYPKVDTFVSSTRELTFIKIKRKRKRLKVLTRIPWRYTGGTRGTPLLHIWSDTSRHEGSEGGDPYGGFIYEGHLIFDNLTRIKPRGSWGGKVFLHMFIITPSKNPQFRPPFKTKDADLHIQFCDFQGKSTVNKATAVWPIPCNDSRDPIVTKVNTTSNGDWIIEDISNFFDTARRQGDLHLKIHFPFNEESKYMLLAGTNYTVEGGQQNFSPKLVFL